MLAKLCLWLLLLAAVVEEVTGKRFSEYLRTAIFEPLGIEDMSFDLPEAEAGRLSALYTADMATKKIREIEKINTFRLTDAYESGGAGIIVSDAAEDVGLPMPPMPEAAQARLKAPGSKRQLGPAPSQ